MSPFEKANARLKEAERERQSGRHLFPAGCSTLFEAATRYEAEIIKNALTLKGGKLAETAAVLGLSYQGLRYLLDTRHNALAWMATPKHRRKSPLKCQRKKAA